jgi:predicted NAD/FAD-dependent oxidoreductase
MLESPPRIEAMADFLLRDIDERVAERIKEIARQKGWPLNDVMLLLIKQALGIVEPEPAPVPGDIARLTGAWNDDEARAFQEAMAAMSSLPDDAPAYLVEEARRKKEAGG